MAFTMLMLCGLFACAAPSRPLQSSSVYQPPETGAQCSELGCALGRVAPPAKLSVGEELQREFDRCLAIGASAECAKEAFATVRKSQGLDERPPSGTVTVRKVPAETENN